MGWVTMSERELNRIEVLAQVDDGRLSVEAAGGLLALTRRPVFRLLKRYRSEGAASIRHKARGRPPNNKLHPARQAYALALIRERYADFGPTLAAETLTEHHGMQVSRETLRKWMIEDGLWLPRQQRRRLHQPRLRRERYGELVQIDGSEHRWFEDRAEPCTLLVFIDDATSKLMELRFVAAESTFAYFEALENYLARHGRPVAFYSDRHSVFRIVKPTPHTTGMTQFGRALAELQIEILCLRDQRRLGQNLMLTYERKRITLEDNALSRALAGSYVDIYEFPDGRLQVRGKGVALPFRVFDKDQRVSHAAIVENKRLGAVLAHIQAEQEKTAPKVRVRPSSARNGYEKTGRRPPGRPSRLDKYYAERRAKAACQPSDP